jgi:hypothetical protein
VRGSELVEKDTMEAEEKFRGIGKGLRQQMKKRWRQEGSGKSLKEWAREALVGDAAAAWIASKQSPREGKR